MIISHEFQTPVGVWINFEYDVQREKFDRLQISTPGQKNYTDVLWEDLLLPEQRIIDDYIFQKLMNN